MPVFDRDALRKDFSDASPHYAAHATLQARIGNMLLAHAMPFIAADALLLDVGAGTGEVTRRWPVRVIALDNAFGMCREAHKKPLPTLQAVAEALPVKSAAVDVVASNLMLQWLAEPKCFFAESARVLKAGGILAVATFTEGTLAELAAAFAAVGEHHRINDFAAPAMLTEKIKSAGFEVLNLHGETITEHYEDMLDLCLYLRDIGANNKRCDRPRGLLTLRKLRAAAGHYAMTEAGLPASWVVQMIVARKTA